METVDGTVRLICSFTNGVDAIDGGLESVWLFTTELETINGPVRLICSFTRGVDAVDDGLELVCSLNNELETVDGGIRLICPFTSGVDAVDDDLEFDSTDDGFTLIGLLTAGVDNRDDDDDDDDDDDSELVCPSIGDDDGTIVESFELPGPLTGADGTFDENCELLTVSGVGAGAIDGFLVATNSEMNDAGAAGTFDG